MEKPRVRICDIAEELGLSTATVSNVLNGKTGKISDETVRRVMERVEAREYLPGRAGILLALNDAKIIGVFLNDHEKYEGHALDDFFIASSLNFLSAEIEGGGRFMMVKRARSAEEIICFASMWNMEGAQGGKCQRAEPFAGVWGSAPEEAFLTPPCGDRASARGSRCAR